MKPLLALAVVASQLIAPAATICAAAPTVIAPDVLLAAGALASAPATGVTFTVPHGFEGKYDPEYGVLNLEGENAHLFVFSYSENEKMISHMFIEIAFQEAIEWTLIEKHEEATPPVFTYRMVGDEEGEFRAVLISLTGDAGNCFGVVANGSPDSITSLRALAESVIASVTWAPPLAKLSEQYAGGSLYSSSSDSKYNTGGAGGSGSYVSEDNVYFHLCRDRYYSFFRETNNSLWAGSAGLQDKKYQEHEGTWSLPVDFVGKATLTLLDKTNKYRLWSFIPAKDHISVSTLRLHYKAGGYCDGR